MDLIRRAFQLSATLAVLVCLSGSVCAQEKQNLKDTPVAVQELLAKKYAKYKVASIRLNEKATEYKVELEKGSRTVSLVLDTDGTILSKNKGRIYSYDGTEKPPNDGTPHNERDGHQH